MWTSKLEVIRIRLKKISNEINDEDMIIHILNNLPEEYNTVVEAMERKLDDLVDLLPLRNLGNDLILNYKRIKKNKRISKDSEDDEEAQDIALVGYTKNFKCRCYNCGNFGHKKEDCPKLSNQMNNNISERYNGMCSYCGKRGHTKSKCRKWKKYLKKWGANIHQENENSDVVLMSHEEEMLICEEILEYQNNESEDEIEQGQVFSLWIRRQMNKKNDII